MLEIGSFRSRACQGVTRRSFVQAAATVPWALNTLAGRATAASGQRAKSVMMIWLWGGPSHIDTFDPKPEADSHVRSPFQSIGTRTTGEHFTELLPRLANRSHHLTVLRSCRFSGNHDMLCLTGSRSRGANRDPNFGSIVAQKHHDSSLPPFVSIAPQTTLSHGFQCISSPGFDAGRLGAAYNPFIVRCSSESEVQIPSLKLLDGLTPHRLSDRRLLLNQLDLLQRHLDSDAINALDKHHHNAYSLLTSSDAFRAFDLRQESPRTHAAYGKTTFGQSMLLGRRLVEAGVPYVQVNWSLGVDGLEEGPLMGWDTHRNGFGQLMNYHCPVFDRAFSALLDDLHERGLLDQTLVVATGEMGRTPEINKIGGRDHWATCSTLWAGGGTTGGRVIGKTDRNGGEPVSSPVSPLMVGTTIAEAMGIDSQARAELGVLRGGTVIEGML
ncbi:MAG: hypothetical protein CMJ77_06900 [Planctomycetaceae bacterium]|nr:hypothetical protein [Planctomycetaceae bacterium]